MHARIHTELLVTLMLECDMVTTTGRLDDGQPTYIGHNCAMRIDHAFVQKHVFHRIHDWQLIHDRHFSDHLPLTFRLEVHEGTTTPHHVVAKPRLKWDYDKRDAYVAHLQSQHERMAHIETSLSTSDVHATDALLRDMIHDAASAVGMKNSTGKRQRFTHTLPLSQEALIVRQRITALRECGRCIPTPLRKEWRHHIKVAKRVKQERDHHNITTTLRTHPRLAWGMYKQNSSHADCVLSTEEWLRHFMDKFGVASHVSTSATHTSIPLPQDCTLMHEVTIDEVKSAFKRLGTNKAVGVDGLPAEFITKASCDGCPINIFHDVLARICNIMLKCQLMPDNWMTKAITHVFKKGVRTDPNNYRPIAVSTTFYRIFTCIIGPALVLGEHE